MLSPAAYYRRWRHGRGYGVHSPFAYHLITEVINQPCAYYAYEQLRAMPRRREAQDAALLFRLAVHFAPSTVWISPGPARKALLHILRLADRNIRTTANPLEANMIIATADALPPLEASLRPSVVTVLLDCESAPAAVLAEKIKREATFGMSFSHDQRHPWIFVAKPGLPRQDFVLKYHSTPRL